MRIFFIFGGAMSAQPNISENFFSLRVVHRKKKATAKKKRINVYPFGLLHKGYNNIVTTNGNSTAQKYSYNGKELQDELGLNWLDYGARNYDASLGRWMNLDPLAEQYYDKSSYVYGLNNPTFFIDPNGKEIDVTDLMNKIKNEENEGDADEARWLLAQMVVGLQDVSGKEIGFSTDEESGKTILTGSGEGNGSEGADYVDHLLGKDTNITVHETKSGSGGFYDGRVFLDASQINGMQEGLEKEGFDKRGMSVGMAFLHETLHTYDGAKFFTSEEDEKNKTLGGRFMQEQYTTDIVNRFRKQINLPVRYQYGSLPGTLYFEKDGNKKTIKYSEKKPNVEKKN